MDHWNMFFHGTLLRTAVVTKVTFEWLLSFMNRCYMSIYVPLFRTSIVTNAAFKWLLSFMHRFNMIIHVILWKTSVFFLSWPDEIWLKEIFLNNFLFAWISRRIWNDYALTTSVTLQICKNSYRQCARPFVTDANHWTWYRWRSFPTSLSARS